ncbi:hypothetical protein B4Q13_15315 [Lacticaseibacillus rhamnosus]
MLEKLADYDEHLMEELLGDVEPRASGLHLVLAGHAHAFEWFRSSLLPTTGLVVTGGGGQPWLWNSILNPRRFSRYRPLYRSVGIAEQPEAQGARDARAHSRVVARVDELVPPRRHRRRAPRTGR